MLELAPSIVRSERFLPQAQGTEVLIMCPKSVAFHPFGFPRMTAGQIASGTHSLPMVWTAHLLLAATVLQLSRRVAVQNHQLSKACLSLREYSKIGRFPVRVLAWSNTPTCDVDCGGPRTMSKCLRLLQTSGRPLMFPDTAQRIASICLPLVQIHLSIFPLLSTVGVFWASQCDVK